MSDDALSQARDTKVRVMGEAYVERQEAQTTRLDREYRDFVNEFAWGRTWSRRTLGSRDRHMVTLALLAASRDAEHFASHVHAALSSGISGYEVIEVLRHVAVYSGVPAASSAVRIAKEIIEAQSEH